MEAGHVEAHSAHEHEHGVTERPRVLVFFDYA